MKLWFLFTPAIQEGKLTYIGSELTSWLTLTDCGSNTIFIFRVIAAVFWFALLVFNPEANLKPQCKWYTTVQLVVMVLLCLFKSVACIGCLMVFQGLHSSVSCSVMSISLQPMDCSLPGFSVHGILQARILEQVAISYSRGSSQPRD